ncbi:AfsA-related hotdog domain-containing protein [Streptomyces sp. NPDC060065]|uniref:AfsA-related hotdog domain-containing protein n=1 Tax=Streptomyces sp. NPDC060065 TaxID=3347050 RepID=UPI00367A71A8
MPLPQSALAPDAATTAPALSYRHTIDRGDVHRWAVSEVFLTDYADLTSDNYLAAAQLPPAHHYFGDHTGPAADAPDSMLLLECCRQAATCIAHRGLGVTRDSAFHVTDWTLELTGATPPPAHGRPREIDIRAAVTRSRVRSGTVRAARYVLELSHGGETLGRCDISARYSPAEEAEIVRRYHRKSAPPQSGSLPAIPPGTPVPPAEVARRDPANVALADARRVAGGVAAVVAVPSGHRTHFDHPQDHYTAMILMEAARQAALLAAGTGVRVTGYRSAFARFAELDAPVRVSAVRRRCDEVAVRFRQDGVIVSEITVGVSEDF